MQVVCPFLIFFMIIKMNVESRVAAFDSEQVAAYGSKEKFVSAMSHMFSHISDNDRNEALGSVYDKAVSEEYKDHEAEETALEELDGE